MATEHDYGLSPEQYHAGLDKLWGALENVKYNGERDVFTMSADRIKELEKVIADYVDYNRDMPQYEKNIPEIKALFDIAPT